MSSNDHIMNLGPTRMDTRYLIGPNLTHNHLHGPKEMMRLTRPQDDHKRIFIYSDPIQPQIVGSKTKGLLREIFIDNNQFTFISTDQSNSSPHQKIRV